MSDGFDAARFLAAQAPVYAQALAELRAGEKRTHWMWFIFPQLAGLGHSPTAHFYALPDLTAAQAYLAHDVLGPRLRAEAGASASLPLLVRPPAMARVDAAVGPGLVHHVAFDGVSPSSSSKVISSWSMPRVVWPMPGLRLRSRSLGWRVWDAGWS